jgi:hypothetical protein
VDKRWSLVKYMVEKDVKNSFAKHHVDEEILEEY